MTLADTLRHLCSTVAADPTSDGELVGRFVRTQDEPAFAELLRRHGPAVYGVCRRVLGNSPDVDDAFQAVFLVLARKARTLRHPQTVGNWLYGVALRTANKARVMNARKASRRCEPPGGLDQQPAVHSAGTPDRDTLAVIDAELAALPERYRAAFVACDLNGQSRSEAARGLGWPEGTVAARLTKARELLAARLSKRGVTLGVGVLTAVSVPTATSAGTLAAVRELLAAGTAAAVAPAAQELADEVVKAMPSASAKWLAVVAALVLATGGAVLLARADDKPPPKAEVASEQAQAVWKEGKALQFAGGGRITSVAYSPDGKYLAIAAGDEVRILDAMTRQQVNEKPIKVEDPATFTALAFHPDRHILAVSCKSGAIFYDVQKQQFRSYSGRDGKLQLQLNNHVDDPHQLSWRTRHEFTNWSDGSNIDKESLCMSNGHRYYSPNNGDRYYTDSERDSEPSISMGEASVLTPIPLDPNPHSFSHYSLLSSIGEGNKFQLQISYYTQEQRLGEVFTGRNLADWFDGHTARPVAAGVTADNTRIVSADEGGTVIVWEHERGNFKEKSRVQLDESAGKKVVQFALAPDGKTVAVLRRTVRNRMQVLEIEDPPELRGQFWDSTRNVPRTGNANAATPVQFELFTFDVTVPARNPIPTATYQLPGRAMPSDKIIYTSTSFMFENGIAARDCSLESGIAPTPLAFSPDGKRLMAAFGDLLPADSPDAAGQRSVGVKVWELVPPK